MREQTGNVIQVLDDLGSCHLCRLREDGGFTVHNDAHSLLESIRGRETHLHKEIDCMLADVASYQNHVGRERHDLLHDDLDVSSMQPIPCSHSTSCESNVDSDAYWYLFL